MKNADFNIVDFHTHILPGADHGSSCVETSTSQLILAKNAGVSRIIATPHFYPHKHKLEDFINRRNEAYEKLKGVLDADMPTIKLGAEVLVCEGLERLSGLEQLCIGSSKVILLEMPFSNITSAHIDTVYNIADMGYEVILAHADRYEKQDIQDLLGSGAKIQLNADSLASFSKKKHLFDWIAAGKVVAIGSDIHHADKSAYKKFLKAKKKLGDAAGKIKEKSDAIWDKL